MTKAKINDLAYVLKNSRGHETRLTTTTMTTTTKIKTEPYGTQTLCAAINP